MATTGNTDGTSTSTVVRTSVTQTRQDVAGEEADSTGLPRLAKFDPEVIKLETWRIQFDSHLSSHGMATDRKKPLLLGSLAPKAMEMLASMCRPKDPGAFTFDELYSPDRGPPPPGKAEVVAPKAETKPPKKPSEKAAAKPPKVPKAPIPEAELRRSDRTRKMPDYLLKDYVMKKIFVEFPPI
ncbi:uncharacterized protein LOC129582191 [Paramacrobiotus metropolitanus]|uniref:uncharacterized protein LOC129582191 n=1 Tax=Paramacrobiotus metropolitanus TaxID=2943436 RepID=UPI002445A7F2|nr:uncharacterized protein LOC129582191 [Paramacrobiotus metropolitanus]